MIIQSTVERVIIMGYSQPLFVYFQSFQKTLQFLQKNNVKFFHPVYSAGIQSHNFHNMSLIP